MRQLSPVIALTPAPAMRSNSWRLTMRYRSLADIRVLDLTHYIAGPYATKLLADMGAEVLKVEPPMGEGGASFRLRWPRS